MWALVRGAWASCGGRAAASVTDLPLSLGLLLVFVLAHTIEARWRYLVAPPSPGVDVEVFAIGAI